MSLTVNSIGLPTWSPLGYHNLTLPGETNLSKLADRVFKGKEGSVLTYHALSKLSHLLPWNVMKDKNIDKLTENKWLF